MVQTEGGMKVAVDVRGDITLCVLAVCVNMINELMCHLCVVVSPLTILLPVPLALQLTRSSGFCSVVAATLHRYPGVLAFAAISVRMSLWVCIPCPEKTLRRLRHPHTLQPDTTTDHR